jgi:hypothetical protein
MAHTFTNFLMHIIFSTKDRVPFIDAEVKPELLAYLGAWYARSTGRRIQSTARLTTFICSSICRRR